MSPADSLFASLPAAPGPHPALAELRAYAAGALAPAEQHRIEAHALDCERCADVLAGLAMSDAATTDQAVAALRAQLQARVQAAPPVATPNWWPRIAAAAALLGAVAGGVWTWEQRSATSGTVASLPETARPATAAPSAPTAAPAPSTAPTPPPAPAATPPADYAAAPPLPPARRPGRLSQAARPAAGPPAQLEQPASFGDADAASAAAAETAAPALASADAAAAPAADKLLATELSKKAAAADSTVGARPGPLAGGLGTSLAKAKARARVVPARSAPATGAAAYVAATPMPAGPALAPAPVGGNPALRAYLSREAAGFLPEPDALRLTGTVRVRLIVGADGKITQLRITRGLRPDYDAEALRIVCEGPAWQPGVAGGQRAALPIELAVPF